MNLKNYKNIHFIGIGGISMSAIAEILKSRGCNVTGSDFQVTEMTEHLKSVGINVFNGHNKDNISPNTDLIVYNAAIKEDNPERAEGRKRGIDEIDRAGLIGELMKRYEVPISVAGTHGKTTTSSMASEVFIEAGLDPTVMIGGILPSIHSNYRLSQNDKYIVLETCEYRDSFLKFNPYASVILNIDRDHTDYFKTMDQMYKSFNAFVNRTAGFVVINSDIPRLDEVLAGFDKRVITFGEKGADWTAENVALKNGYGKYDACYKGKKVMEAELSVPGMHNVSNSLSVVALCSELGVNAEAIGRGIKNFTGTGRRFEKKGEYKGALIVDDYAHHPTEITATLKAAKEMGFKRIVAAFQPHTYTRTRDLKNEFISALSLADKIFVADIYAAREKDPGDIHSKDIVSGLAENGRDAVYAGSYERCEELLKDDIKEGDIVLTIGAGPINEVGEKILGK